MRVELKKLNNKRLRFRATVERFGKKPSYIGVDQDTILLKNVICTLSQIQVTDHIWLIIGKTIKSLNLQIGDLIEFDARVSKYIKGYVNHKECIDNRTTDYKFSNPTKFKILNNN